MSNNQMREALQNLVDGLNKTHWSSWQTTAHFQDALKAAEQALAAEPAEETQHSDDEADLEAIARKLLADEYEKYGIEGSYPTYANLAKNGKGEFTLRSIRAIVAALKYTRSTSEALRKLPRLTDEELAACVVLSDSFCDKENRWCVNSKKYANAIMEAMEAKAALNADRSNK